MTYELRTDHGVDYLVEVYRQNLLYTGLNVPCKYTELNA